MRANVLLFDLDGTVSDSAPVILDALRHAFVANGLPPLPDERARALLGPPFYETLPPIVGADRFAAVLADYRARYATQLRTTRAFDGMPELITALRERGIRLAVATSKNEPQATQVVEHLGLLRCFHTVGGDTLDGRRPTKADVIAHVLAALGNPDPARVLMVGDRSHDVLGARAHGIACAGAGWGYALPGELAGAGADPICATPVELARVLGVAADAAAR